MTSASDAHNSVLLPILTMILKSAATEEEQWVLLETICLGIGVFHHRTPRQTATFVETMAERLATGERA